MPSLAGRKADVIRVRIQVEEWKVRVGGGTANVMLAGDLTSKLISVSTYYFLIKFLSSWL